MTEQWIRLKPRLLSKPPEDGQVTYSLTGSQGNRCALTRLNMSRVIMTALGWAPKAKIIVDHSPDGSKLRLRQAERGEELDGYTLGLRGTTGTLTVRLTWMLQYTGNHPAQRTNHQVDPDAKALLVDVPEWSRPSEVAAASPSVRTLPNPAERFGGAHRGRPKKLVEGAPMASPPAKPKQKPPASLRAPITAAESASDDEAEGKDMLRSGRSVREISDWLGTYMETVRRWKSEVDKEGSAAA